jgi:diketogulonate reductase-like aldo/keto reductase
MRIIHISIRIRSTAAATLGVSNYEVHHVDELLRVADIPPVVNQCDGTHQL